MEQKATIEPGTRVEGHGKVTIQLDDQGNMARSGLHFVEFNGFERYVQGRPYWEAPVLVQRICGICPVSQHLAAAKALDVIVGAGPGDQLSPTAEKMRRLMHYGQMFHSHALHFFHTVSPDLLFGVDGNPAVRSMNGVALKHPDLATQSVMMRKYGQEIISATAGKKINGTGAIPGGIIKNLSIAERDILLYGTDLLNIENMIIWAQNAVVFYKEFHKKHAAMLDGFSQFPSNHLSLVRSDGALDFYHGVLRAVDAKGNRVLNDVDYQEYLSHIGEEVRSGSYMKITYLKHLGKEKGWFRVGPLARLNTCDFIPSPLAQKEFEEYKAYTADKVNNICMHTHWARIIELLHSAEVIRDLLNDQDLQGDNLVIKGAKCNEGIGLIEAPGGTLFHHYRINEHDQISMANLIDSTTNNNEPMNQTVNFVVKAHTTRPRSITEPMMNAVEVAIRAYDPCLSCATHALGKMPLEISLVDPNGNVLDRKMK
ncbi:MAG: Ni/Fe hydrogenase subunit alpha [Bacteroidetes bacterium]|nr:Ni/Fe hydrogenase subunit alpha [Bacteroidota bacterium]MBU1720031.1 Ni/Fe hydrogenase subunit alpha [Bacteroidota bacterium]